jgi:hypothetical protein
MSSSLIERHLLPLLAGLGVLTAIVAAPSHATLAGRNGLLAYQATAGNHIDIKRIPNVHGHWASWGTATN